MPSYLIRATKETILPGQICSWADGQCETVHPGLKHSEYENQYTLEPAFDLD